MLRGKSRWTFEDVMFSRFPKKTSAIVITLSAVNSPRTSHIARIFEAILQGHNFRKAVSAGCVRQAVIYGKRTQAVGIGVHRETPLLLATTAFLRRVKYRCQRTVIYF